MIDLNPNKDDYVTIYDICAFLIGKPEEECLNGQHFYDCGLPITGGCACNCGENLAAYNMYPSDDGYIYSWGHFPIEKAFKNVKDCVEKFGLYYTPDPDPDADDGEFCNQGEGI